MVGCWAALAVVGWLAVCLGVAAAALPWLLLAVLVLLPPLPPPVPLLAPLAHSPLPNSPSPASPPTAVLVPSVTRPPIPSPPLPSLTSCLAPPPTASMPLSPSLPPLPPPLVLLQYYVAPSAVALALPCLLQPASTSYKLPSSSARRQLGVVLLLSFAHASLLTQAFPFNADDLTF